MVCVFLVHWESEHVIVSSSVVLQRDPNTTRDTAAIKVWNALAKSRKHPENIMQFIYNTSGLHRGERTRLQDSSESDGRHVMLIWHKSLTEVLGLFCCHPLGRPRMRANVFVLMCARDAIFMTNSAATCLFSERRLNRNKESGEWEINSAHLTSAYAIQSRLPFSQPTATSQTLWGQQIINI